MLPVPANKSRMRSSVKLKLLFKILNKASLHISVVGRTGKFLGGEILLPLYFPEIIRTCVWV
ncbi:hypothetical protein FPS14_contig00026-0031 [Flavobacterium psychrophilum]|nr:hypothetical protein FPS14_contig00026-0031 [Flavobacterium psychrophilum]